MIAALLGAVLASAPIVATDAGAIRGEPTADGRALFRGIPFAAPPVGDLRWRPPMPVTHWQGLRDATRSAAACPQIDYGWNHAAAAYQSEDCLYLEVATPALHPARPLPVMVWVHGGGNRAGSGAGTIGSPIVQRGVVLVSLQYRLGAMGFLSHAALGRRSGNFGLMDQQAALRWVHRNIARFGGDPANVTIFGQSAGAQDIGLQLLSPGARGLFAKAIEESGSAGFGTPLRSLAENESLGAMIATAAGAAPGADAAALRRLPVDALVRAAEAADVRGLDDDSFIWLQAVVDGSVLTEPPATTLARGGGARVPLLIGNNSTELTLYGGAAGAGRAIDRAFPRHAAEAGGFYEADRDAGAQLADDINFRCPALWVAGQRARAGMPTWHYQFGLAGSGGEPVAHGSEIRFVLGSEGAGDTAIAPLAAYWVNFARTGDPNGAGLPAWPRYDAARRSISFGATGAKIVANLRPVCDLRAAP